MNIPATANSERIADDPGFGPRFEQLREACAAGSAIAAFEKLGALHADADRFIEGLKRDLFRAPLAWNEQQKAASRWIALQHHRLARHARRVADVLAKDAAAGPKQKALATAFALHHLAEAMKCEMADNPRGAQHFSALHALMKSAIASGFERLPIFLQVQGADNRCTVESLFLRALLLARSGGVLSNQQVEILDAWFWLWMPALRGEIAKPAGGSMRVDLDSTRGLARTAEGAAGSAFYLPLPPLEGGFRTIVQQFQEGVIVPSEGHASRFRMEEHMVVLDMVRRTLRGMNRPPMVRARREPSGVSTELHVGLPEIMSRGFKSAAPATPGLELLTLQGGERPKGSGEASPFAAIFDIARRHIQVIDVSASGLGLAGELPECAEIQVGDIVALRLTPGGPLELGKVARRAFAQDSERVVIGIERADMMPSGRVVIGVRQLSAGVQQLEVTQGARGGSSRPEMMLFVPGQDSTGRQDAFLVSESAMVQGRAYDAAVGDLTFSFRLNRVRDRGRGWLLAGFEIFGMRKVGPLLAAA
jgi:hypothetical protein